MARREVSESVLLGSERLRHTGVRSLAISGDGSLLVSGNRGVVKAWNDEGRLLDFVSVDSGPMTSVDISPSKKWVVVQEKSGPAWLLPWRDGFGEGRAFHECGERSMTRGTRFFPDETGWIAADRENLCVVPLDGGAVKTVPSASKIHAFDIGPDGIVYVLRNDGLFSWSRKATDMTLVATLDAKTLDVSRDGKWAVTTKDAEVSLIDTATGKIERVEPGVDARMAVFAPDNSRLALAGARLKAVLIGSGSEEMRAEVDRRNAKASESIAIYDRSKRSVTTRLGDHGHWVSALAFADETGVLASAGDGDASIRRWGADGTPLDGPPKSPVSATRSARPLGGNSTVVTMHEDGARTWDSTSGRQLERYSLPGLTALSASSRGSTVAAWKPGDRRVAIYREGLGGKATEIETPYELEAIALSADGSTLATAGPSTSLHLWNTSSGTQTQELQRQLGEFPTSVEYEVNALAVSADAGRIVVANFKGIQIWDGATGETLEMFQPHGSTKAASISDDGEWVATVAQGSDEPPLRVWGPPNYRPIEVVTRGETGMAVALSPNGTRLVVAATDNGAVGKDWLDATVQLLRYDGNRFVPVTALQGHSESITDLAFMPQGPHIVSASRDTTARVWPLP